MVARVAATGESSAPPEDVPIGGHEAAMPHRVVNSGELVLPPLAAQPLQLDLVGDIVGSRWREARPVARRWRFSRRGDENFCVEAIAEALADVAPQTHLLERGIDPDPCRSALALQRVGADLALGDQLADPPGRNANLAREVALRQKPHFSAL